MRFCHGNPLLGEMAVRRIVRAKIVKLTDQYPCAWSGPLSACIVLKNSKIVELQKSRERRPLANFCRRKAASLKLIKQIWLMPRLAIGRQRSYMFDITARPGWRALRSRPNETGAVTKIKLGVTGWMCATNAAEGKAESTQAWRRG